MYISIGNIKFYLSAKCKRVLLSNGINETNYDVTESSMPRKYRSKHGIVFPRRENTKRVVIFIFIRIYIRVYTRRSNTLENCTI